MIHLTLFWEFFKIGLFAIGGGMAAIPFLRHLSLQTNWFSIAFLTDMVAISESTPGPIGINMATYAGYHVAGPLGGVIATLAMITPSLIIVTVVSGYLEKFKHSHLVKDAFIGLRPAVTGLIAVAGFEIIKGSVFAEGNFPWFIKGLFFLGVFYAIRKYQKHPVFYIVISAILGILFKMGTSVN